MDSLIAITKYATGPIPSYSDKSLLIIPTNTEKKIKTNPKKYKNDVRS
jgi:hypothetical protein